MELTRFSRVSRGIFLHDFFSSLVKPSTFFGGDFSFCMLSCKIDQRFSMGFRSGELGGHSSFPQNWISLSWSHWVVVAAVWQRAPSCIKTNSDFLRGHFRSVTSPGNPGKSGQFHARQNESCSWGQGPLCYQIILKYIFFLWLTVVFNMLHYFIYTLY